MRCCASFLSAAAKPDSATGRDVVTSCSDVSDCSSHVDAADMLDEDNDGPSSIARRKYMTNTLPIYVDT